MLTENMIAKMTAAELDEVAAGGMHTDDEIELAEKEIDRREFDAQDHAAIYGAGGRHDDELDPIGSYSS